MGERFILIMAIVGVLAAWLFAERGCQIRSGERQTYSERAYR